MKNKNRKIVCVGQAKTGTTTCGVALKILGFKHVSNKIKSVGWVMDKILSKKPNCKKSLKLKRMISKYESFDDYPWKTVYKYIDRTYKDSKFILTVRKNHRIRAVSGWYHNNPINTKPSEKWIRNKIKTSKNWNRDIINYFKNRKDKLIILCWENGDSWKELCNFLDIDIPNKKFPHCKKRFNGKKPDVYFKFQKGSI